VIRLRIWVGLYRSMVVGWFSLRFLEVCLGVEEDDGFGGLLLGLKGWSGDIVWNNRIPIQLR
jgi:hypothetical protein